MADTLTARPTKRLVTRLNTVGRDDLAVAGGKGANLGELIQGGFPVPDGFVVSTEAYAAVVEGGGLAAVIADGLTADDGGAAIRAAFADVVIPDGLVTAILEAYRDLGGGPVAVRSSATAEDLPGAAFAGQQDTYLNVVGDDAVLDAVRRCWGSLWTERAIAYRDRQGIDPGEVRIAVVVQEMVDAEFAGVMFTAEPVTGDRSAVVVDASSGLGEAVVSGLVTPDHYVLDASGRVRNYTPGRREVVIRSAAGGGVTRAKNADATTLPDTVPAELAALGRAVAAHFGRPQDVEWAYADGRVWLVQARPMTALPPPPLRLTRRQRQLGLQLMDYMSVRPYPLDMSAWVLPGIGRMVQRMLAEIPGLRADVAGMLPEREGVVERFVPCVPQLTPAVLTAPIRVARLVRRYDPATWTADPRYARFQEAVRELAGLDPAASSWPQLMRHRAPGARRHGPDHRPAGRLPARGSGGAAAAARGAGATRPAWADRAACGRRPDPHRGRQPRSGGPGRVGPRRSGAALRRGGARRGDPGRPDRARCAVRRLPRTAARVPRRVRPPGDRQPATDLRPDLERGARDGARPGRGAGRGAAAAGRRRSGRGRGTASARASARPPRARA